MGYKDRKKEYFWSMFILSGYPMVDKDRKSEHYGFMSILSGYSMIDNDR